MTSTKAIAGGIGANIITVVLWAVSHIPGWNAMPEQPRAAILALVSAGVGAAIVYFAPANQHTLPQVAPESGGEARAPFGTARTLAEAVD